MRKTGEDDNRVQWQKSNMSRSINQWQKNKQNIYIIHTHIYTHIERESERSGCGFRFGTNDEMKRNLCGGERLSLWWGSREVAGGGSGGEMAVEEVISFSLFFLFCFFFPFFPL